MYYVIFVPLKNDPDDAALLQHATRAAGGAAIFFFFFLNHAGPHRAETHPYPLPCRAQPLARCHFRPARRCRNLPRGGGPAPPGPGVPRTDRRGRGRTGRGHRGAAAESGADLIVMGSHGHSQVRHFLLGSVTEAVIRGSEIPVLVVRPGPGED